VNKLMKLWASSKAEILSRENPSSSQKGFCSMDLVHLSNGTFSIEPKFPIRNPATDVRACVCVTSLLQSRHQLVFLFFLRYRGFGPLIYPRADVNPKQQNF
jgi:hypothetical protein